MSTPQKSDILIQVRSAKGTKTFRLQDDAEGHVVEFDYDPKTGQRAATWTEEVGLAASFRIDGVGILMEEPPTPAGGTDTKEDPTVAALRTLTDHVEVMSAALMAVLERQPKETP